MSAEKVVSLADEREKRSPHMQGKARCLACKQEWRAVAPVGTIWLACPSCTLERGRFITYCEMEGVEHWTCNCGCDVFYVTRTNSYCPNCGTVQNFT